MNQSATAQEVEYSTSLLAKQRKTIESGTSLPDVKTFRAGEPVKEQGMFVYNTYTGPSYTTNKKHYVKFSFDDASNYA